MTQQINPEKLKAAAEHLEWVCQQYPNSDDVQGLYRGLQSMIEDAKAGRILLPVEDRQKIPGWYFNREGIYQAYTAPDVEGAYVNFSVEMRGGYTEQEKRIMADMELERKAILEKEHSKKTSTSNDLNLTPEQQAIFERVVGIVTQNSELRQRFKAANDEMDKHPEGNELEYVVDSDDPAAVEFRAASDAIDMAILGIEPSLKVSDRWLFRDIAHAICTNFCGK